MTPERIAELTALCEKAKEMAPTYTEILLQPSIKDQTCTRVEECAYYDLSATRQLHNEIAASVGSALPEILAELTRLTRERDEAYEAGMREAGSIATLEPDLHVKSEYQAGYEQGRNAASVAIYERATAIRALRKPKTGGE